MTLEDQEPDQTNESDQRYLPRWESKNRVVFQSEDYTHPQEGQTKDLSCAGVCFNTPINLNPHQKIRLTIYLSVAAVIRVDGEVVWIQPKGQENQIGVTFSNMTQQNQALILEHAFELNRQQVVNHWFDGWDGKESA